MTIRKQWLIFLILITLMTIIINSILLSTFTDKYFLNYIKENYDKHLSEIIEYSTNILNTKDINRTQIEIDLETHLNEPINGIKLYNKNSELIANVYREIQSFNKRGMMNGMMRGMFGESFEEVDSYILYDDNNESIGQVHIIRASNLKNSITSLNFKYSLFKNSFLSGILVLLIAIFMGLSISKKMSNDLIYTANQAQNIDLGKETKIEFSKTKEINIIQRTLETQKIKLALKQKGRKTLLDSMVHQTRTPLTILKTHLEAIEDEIIKPEANTMKIMKDQIDNITKIVLNMSSMIDGEKEESVLHIEKFDLKKMLEQIIGGLKIQFENNNIELFLENAEKLVLNTDKYLLSQSIYNILTNAYKYSKPLGRVVLNYKKVKDKVQISITDNGIGINENEIERVFNAYFKGKQQDDKTGDGIGLYIAMENIKRLDGDIKLHSKENIGSTFEIIIPI